MVRRSGGVNKGDRVTGDSLTSQGVWRSAGASWTFCTGSMMLIVNGPLTLRSHRFSSSG
jgi:hypothetical protein